MPEQKTPQTLQNPFLGVFCFHDEACQRIALQTLMPEILANLALTSETLLTSPNASRNLQRQHIRRTLLTAFTASQIHNQLPCGWRFSLLNKIVLSIADESWMRAEILVRLNLAQRPQKTNTPPTIIPIPAKQRSLSEFTFSPDELHAESTSWLQDLVDYPDNIAKRIKDLSADIHYRQIGEHMEPIRQRLLRAKAGIIELSGWNDMLMGAVSHLITDINKLQNQADVKARKSTPRSTGSIRHKHAKPNYENLWLHDPLTICQYTLCLTETYLDVHENQRRRDTFITILQKDINDVTQRLKQTSFRTNYPEQSDLLLHEFIPEARRILSLLRPPKNHHELPMIKSVDSRGVVMQALLDMRRDYYASGGIISHPANYLPSVERFQLPHVHAQAYDELERLNAEWEISGECAGKAWPWPPLPDIKKSPPRGNPKPYSGPVGGTHIDNLMANQDRLLREVPHGGKEPTDVIPPETEEAIDRTYLRYLQRRFLEDDLTVIDGTTISHNSEYTPQKTGHTKQPNKHRDASARLSLTLPSDLNNASGDEIVAWMTSQKQRQKKAYQKEAELAAQRALEREKSENDTPSL